MTIQALATVRTWFTQAYQRFSALPFLFILIAIEVYFYANGKAHFENWSSTYGQLITVYLMMTIIFLLWAGRRTQEQLKKPIKDSAFAFVLFFIGTYIVLYIVSQSGFISTGTTLPRGMFWQTVMMQICVVATSEELMFRGVLLEYTGIIVSSILFAIWHSYAYQIIWYQLDLATLNYGAIIFAFVMGIILAYVAKRREWGLPASIGIHAAYNLVVVGAFIT